MISRWMSSGWPPRCSAAALWEKLPTGAGSAIGSNPRFRIIHARSTVMVSLLCCPPVRGGSDKQLMVCNLVDNFRFINNVQLIFRHARARPGGARYRYQRESRPKRLRRAEDGGLRRT